MKLMKLACAMLLGTMCIQALPVMWTGRLLTTAWRQPSPQTGPYNAGGEMSMYCSHNVPGTSPQQIVYNTINTANFASHAIYIGILLPGGSRVPCHVPVSFDAHGATNYRIIGTGQPSIPGVESGVFTMSWTYNNVYYQAGNYMYLWCDGLQVHNTFPFAYPC